MQAEDGVAVRTRARNDVVQDLTRGHGGADCGAQDGHAVMARLWSEDNVQRKAKTRGGEPGALQDAERTGKIAEPELIDKGEREHGVDGHQRQSVEQLRHVTRHATLPRSKRDIQHVGHVHAEQHEQHHQPRDPKTHRRRALSEPSRTEPAGKEKKG